MIRFPIDCPLDCPHLEAWDMSIDDWTYVCDELKTQIDGCDTFFKSLLPNCPIEAEKKGGMIDPVDRHTAIEKLKRRKEFFCKNRIEFGLLPENDKSRVDEIDACIEMLTNLPSAQPSVIRCKECKKFYEGE